MDLLSLQPRIYKITKTTRWEVVKNSATPKRHIFLKTTPTSNPKKGGAYSFSYWDTPTSGQKGGGHVPEMPPPLDLPMRECSSTLYVAMAHTAPPTNTNFQITFLLTRLLEALYEDLPEIY